MAFFARCLQDCCASFSSLQGIICNTAELIRTVELVSITCMSLLKPQHQLDILHESLT